MSSDDMVTCPYDQTHRLLRRRLVPHLIKCKRDHPETELQTCFFDKTHLVPKSEFQMHVINCPGKKVITEYKYNAPLKEDSPKWHKTVESDENWDDTNVADYNPRAYIEKANVLRFPIGMKRSERRVFTQQEIKRLRNLEVENYFSVEEKVDDQSSEDVMQDVPAPPSWRSCLNSIQSVSFSPLPKDKSKAVSRKYKNRRYFRNDLQDFNRPIRKTVCNQENDKFILKNACKI